MDFNDVTTQRSMIDGKVSMSVASSKNAINTYGFCAHSSFFELAPKGELENFITHHDRHGVTNFEKLTSRDKLKMCLDMARGVADIHGIVVPEIVVGGDEDSSVSLEASNATNSIVAEFETTNSRKAQQAKVVIMDVKPGNMLLMDDMTVKVNDFNNGELLMWNTTRQSACDFRRRNGISVVRVVPGFLRAIC
jgi:serine/threonine protein kinase